MATKKPQGTTLQPSGSMPKELVIPSNWYTETDRFACATTYDLTTQEGRRGVLDARQADCQGAEDWINKTMDITHVVFHPIELVSEQTGELAHEIRTVVTLAGGGHVQFVSRGVVDAFMLICKYGRPGPWNPPIRLLLKRKSISGGKSTYTLTEVE